jgi:NIPSNAP
MLRLLPIVGLSLVGLSLLAAAGPQNAANRVFEMRTYTTEPGRLDALNKRFRDHTNKLFVKHGMDLVGYWTLQGKDDTLVYILAYPSLAAREASWKAFQADPDWKAAREASEKDGKIVAKTHSIFLDPTDYSPIK